MPETTQLLFSHKEIAELLVKHQNLHEGLWRLTIQFGILAMNIASPGGSETLPAAIVPVQKIGLQRVELKEGETLDNITVDASKVNPLP